MQQQPPTLRGSARGQSHRSLPFPRLERLRPFGPRRGAPALEHRLEFLVGKLMINRLLELVIGGKRGRVDGAVVAVIDGQER